NLRLDPLRKRKSETQDDIIASVRPDETTALSLLEEADALARAGKYAEAVHLLLFRSIADIQERRPGRLSTALTAREIGALSDLPARPRTALAPIIALVERSFFGGQPLLEVDWKDARSSYETFAFGDVWG
ncbi:MAG: hypothetical protein AAGJ50_14215, partial [Pseudomonadota bacterium]